MCDMNQETLKECVTCGESKPLNRFSRTSHIGKNGERTLFGTCKDCISLQIRNRYQKDAKFRAKQIVHSHNSNKRSQGRRVNVDEAVKILTDTRYCPYCGIENEGGLQFELDHKVPLAKGGEHVLDNLAACCGYCNRAKMDRTAEEYREWLQGVAQRLTPRLAS